MIYRFGNFEIDASTRELRLSGEHVDTEPKAFELLLYLVSNRDRAISKDELLNELWPQTIVTETALTRCVMKARRAVGDDSNAQAVIRTLHSHGYRFVAEVDADQAEPDAPAPERSAAAELDRPAPAHTKRAVVMATAALLVVLAIASVTQLVPSSNARVGALAVLPVSNQTNDEELVWVRAGLMSLLKRMLEDGGVSVVSERGVLSAIGDASLAMPPDEALFDRIREQSGADSVLYTALDAQGGLNRLSAVITHSDGRKTRRVIVGKSPAALAAEMATVVSGLVSGADMVRDRRFSKVSTDPFVNEMYGRALDMELHGKLEEARQLFRVAADQEPELFWLRYEIALCTRDLEEWDEAERLFAALEDEARSGADARALVATLNSQGVMQFNRNHYDAAESFFLQALDSAGERDFARERASIYTNLGLISGRRGKTEEARRYYESALSAYDDYDRQPAPTFYNNYAGLLMSLGDLDEAQAYSQRAIDGFRLRGQRRFEAPSLNRMAKILRRRGDTEAAIARHEEALAIYRELDNTVGELSVMIALTAIAREKGDLTRARHSAQEVVTRAAETDNTLLQADAHISLAYVEAAQADHASASADFETAIATFRALGDDSGLRAANMGLALSALALGDSARAGEIGSSMLRSAIDAGSEAAESRARWLLGEVAQSLGNADRAREHFGSALAYGRNSKDTSIRARAAISLANLYLAEEKLDDAAALLEELRLSARSSLDIERLDARLSIARGDSTRALEILTALRKQAGEAWRPEDEALLGQLE